MPEKLKVDLLYKGWLMEGWIWGALWRQTGNTGSTHSDHVIAGSIGNATIGGVGRCYCKMQQVPLLE